MKISSRLFKISVFYDFFSPRGEHPLTLTTDTVRENIPSRPDYTKADWSKLNSEIDEEMVNISISERMDKQTIDSKLDQRYNITEHIIGKNIPTKSSITIQRSVTRPQLRNLQHRFNQ